MALRKIKPEDLVYVTATCKKCHKAFMLPDSNKNGRYNDTPPTHFYCPECEKAGLKNKKSSVRGTPEEFLNDNKITDKIVRKQFKAIFKRRGKNRSYASVLKEAVEVAGYIKADLEK